MTRQQNIPRMEEERAFSPLERFLRRYATELGGGYDEVEPQVYDLLWDGGLARVSFDPEALADHPDAQLASFGSPLISALLDDAARRGATCIAQFHGLNLRPNDLAGRFGRTFSLPAGSTFQIERARPLLFPQCVCWFELTFESDQREQDLLSVVIDLASGRPVRQIDRLLDWTRLSAHPALVLPTARCRSVREGCLLAGEHAVCTATALANTRRRELAERLGSICHRMNTYYDQMLRELDERAAKDESVKQKRDERRQTIERERALRLAEVERKHALRVSMGLVNLLLILLPKLSVSVSLRGPGGRVSSLTTTFDLLAECFEPIDCARCGKPTLELRQTRQGALVCPLCG